LALLVSCLSLHARPPLPAHVRVRWCRPPPSEPQWGNFFETLQRKLVAKIPAAFLTVYADHLGQSPSDDDFDLVRKAPA
jgi:hypothetical protein